MYSSSEVIDKIYNHLKKVKSQKESSAIDWSSKHTYQQTIKVCMEKKRSPISIFT